MHFSKSSRGWLLKSESELVLGENQSTPVQLAEGSHESDLMAVAIKQISRDELPKACNAFDKKSEQKRFSPHHCPLRSPRQNCSHAVLARVVVDAKSIVVAGVVKSQLRAQKHRAVHESLRLGPKRAEQV